MNQAKRSLRASTRPWAGALPARPLRAVRGFHLDRTSMEAHQPAGLGPSTRARHLPAGRVLRGMKRDLTGRDLYARVERLQHLVQHRLEW